MYKNILMHSCSNQFWNLKTLTRKPFDISWFVNLEMMIIQEMVVKICAILWDSNCCPNFWECVRSNPKTYYLENDKNNGNFAPSPNMNKRVDVDRVWKKTDQVLSVIFRHPTPSKKNPHTSIKITELLFAIQLKPWTHNEIGKMKKWSFRAVVWLWRKVIIFKSSLLTKHSTWNINQVYLNMLCFLI